MGGTHSYISRHIVIQMHRIRKFSGMLNLIAAVKNISNKTLYLFRFSIFVRFLESFPIFRS